MMINTYYNYCTKDCIESIEFCSLDYDSDNLVEVFDIDSDADSDIFF